MIIPVKKYLFLGTKKDLNLFFDHAQKKGIIQFIPAITKEIVRSREIQDIFDALKILKHYPYHHSIFPEGVPYQELVDSVLEKQKELDHLIEEKFRLKNEIMKIQPLGDFSFEDLKKIEESSENKFHFYFSKRASIIENKELILINTDHEFDFYLGFSKQPVHEFGLNEIVLKECMSTLKNSLEFVYEKIKQNESSLRKIAPYSNYLRDCLLEKINEQELKNAKEAVTDQLDDHLFSVQAWVPENKTGDLIDLTKDSSIHFEEIRIEENDKIPTCMENHGLGKVGEDLVKIFDVPATVDKDPSRWVLFAFALFYAIIISDAGYGVLYLFLAQFLKYKFPKAQDALKRTIKLINFVAVFSIFWGVMTCSYFSIKIAPDAFLGKIAGINYLVGKKANYHIQQKDDVYEEWIGKFPELKGSSSSDEFILQAKVVKGTQVNYLVQEEFADNILMELSLLIGVIHISLSFLRNIKGSYAGIGWVLTLVGGYLYFPNFLNATSLINFLGVLSKPVATYVGLQLLTFGTVLAMVLAVIQNKLRGLGEIFTSIQVFSDVLSYLRLYALGLAGMIMAGTFNSIGEQLGLVAGAIVIMIGHITNITLGIMSGVLHGLRLNFFEWYHYSFLGGGRLFAPLRLLREKLQ